MIRVGLSIVGLRCASKIYSLRYLSGHIVESGRDAENVGSTSKVDDQRSSDPRDELMGRLDQGEMHRITSI